MFCIHMCAWGVLLQNPLHNGQFCQKELNEKITTDNKCSNFSSSVKFNLISREENPEITIKSYKDQSCEKMIRNGIWDVSSLLGPQKKDKNWNIFLNQ